MKTQNKKLNLKKTTITVLNKPADRNVFGGALPTKPIISCRVVCAVSIQNPCITQSEIC